MGPFRHLRHHVVQDFELAPREEEVQRFSDTDHNDQHQGEQDRCAGERFDYPQHDQARQLDQGEQMNATDRDLWE